MDWNLILFLVKWVMIGLFYAVLFILLFNVYREMARGVPKQKFSKSAHYGRLKVMAAGNALGLHMGSILNLTAETRLGADPDNDLPLNNSYISRHHACLHWDGTTWWVEDLNSRNGTVVNQHRCTPGSPYPVPDGSVLSLGDMTFELIYPDRR